MMKKNVRILALLLCTVFLFAGIMTACSKGDDTTDGNEQNGEENTGEENEGTVEVDYDQYEIGETVETDAGLSITLNSCTIHLDEDPTVVAIDGYELQKMNVTVANNTAEAIDFSTIYFKYRVEGTLYEDGYKNERFGVTVEDGLLSGSLEPGDTRTGSLVYDVPVGTGYLMYVSDTDIGPEFEYIVTPE